MEAMFASPDRLILFARRTDDLDLIAFYYEQRADHLFIRIGLAQNSDTPAWMLTELSHDPAEQVRSAVASNPNADDDTIRYLADEDAQAVYPAREEGWFEKDWFTYHAAKNPSLPEDLSSVLAHHRSEVIRSVIAARTDTSVETLLWMILRDKRAVVRQAAKAQDFRIRSWLRTTHPQLAGLEVKEAARRLFAIANHNAA
ncbi:hypothetical protein FQ330_03165 [Agrococcus sediminis]|uniref:HEAT repeat domain-containing protein n=1 Tax=Agrococcus sediminis TaxID=2599924 RepID=A0A5M8QMD4_9MICO|nr:hypothetical protein [Agrococcus sediminis]KAA6436418.1 hypothetical protein FQ330_03165 [Agrococcus sediminis]